MATYTIPGMHHITAIAGDPQRNLDFYMSILGQRLVKKTINFDDPGTYHLYYGDEIGTPGTILTFFPWPGAPKGRKGTGQVVDIAFAIPINAINYWIERLRAHNIEVTGPTTRFGDQVLSFSDPDGLSLELVAHNGPDRKELVWKQGPIPEEYAIRGFYSVTLAEAQYERTAALLINQLGFTFVGQEGNRYRYHVGDDASGAIVDVLSLPNERRGHVARGAVHHVAWRTPDDAQELAWQEQLLREGNNVTEVRDRQYFHSIYFNEPGGVLFEIATNPPGFTFDESIEELGTHLKLPPWLEPNRKLLEATLPELHLPTIEA